MMSLVPHESPLLRVPTDISRRDILFYDGIRYCLHTYDLTNTRFIESLRTLSLPDQKSHLLAERIASAINDAWTLIDVTHRLRELLSQLPRLKKSTPELQLFLRTTKSVESLRHFYQHFRTEIEQFTLLGSPLCGSLSWVYTDPQSGENSCFVIVPGTFFPGVSAPSCTIDRKKSIFVERIAFFASSQKIDIAVLSERLIEFCAWYTNWYETTILISPDQQSGDYHMHFKVQAPIAKKKAGYILRILQYFGLCKPKR